MPESRHLDTLKPHKLVQVPRAPTGGFSRSDSKAAGSAAAAQRHVQEEQDVDHGTWASCGPSNAPAWHPADRRNSPESLPFCSFGCYPTHHKKSNTAGEPKSSHQKKIQELAVQSGGQHKFRISGPHAMQLSPPRAPLSTFCSACVKGNLLSRLAVPADGGVSRHGFALREFGLQDPRLSIWSAFRV